MNELVRVEQPNADVRAYRASTEAAEICKEIVVAASSTIQGRRFVSVEGWSAIAVAHGCTLSARDVEKVDGGVRAIGEVRRMSDGQLIATGEGFVGEDETTWYGGKDKRGKIHEKRADYAIRAMAQTRAMSRAGRTAFAHVVVMMKAGLATTPAEEMIAIDGETGEVFEAADKPVATISDAQRDLIATTASAAGVSLQKICDTYGIGALTQLPADLYETVMESLRLTIEKKRTRGAQQRDPAPAGDILDDNIPY